MKCAECPEDIPESDMPGHNRYHRRNEADAASIAAQPKKVKIKRDPIDPDAKNKRFLEG